MCESTVGLYIKSATAENRDEKKKERKKKKKKKQKKKKKKKKPQLQNIMTCPIAYWVTIKNKKEETTEVK